jgi:hypothetical protein
METAPLGRFFCRRRSGPRAAGKLRHMRTIGQHRTSRDQHATARQCLLQLSDRALRRRRTVRLFDMAKQGLQSRLLVSYRPPACKHPGLVKACDPHDLGGTGQTGIEIIDRGRGHLITCKPSRKAKSEAGRKQSEAVGSKSENQVATMWRPNAKCNHADSRDPRYSPDYSSSSQCHPATRAIAWYLGAVVLGIASGIPSGENCR